jgi:LysR family transcriptional regulator, transcriptional activator of nhaA
MDWLNYHHLYYFWSVAREGSLSRASAELRLAPSTLSGQIRLLEQQLGIGLFSRVGRGQALTEPGKLVFRYADDIFRIGRELKDSLRGRTVGHVTTIVVGVADVLPKLVARRLLEPVFSLGEAVQLVCREDKSPRLLAELALHNVDVVLSDTPLSPSTPIRAFSHLLGECGVSFFGTTELCARYKRRFPDGLEQARVLLPSEHTALRRSLDSWFAERKIRPRVVGEFDDSALMKVFGQNGSGLFPAASVIADEVVRQYQVKELGQLEGVRERFYVISTERRLKDPAVLAITRAARSQIFGGT